MPAVDCVAPSVRRSAPSLGCPVDASPPIWPASPGCVAAGRSSRPRHCTVVGAAQRLRCAGSRASPHQGGHHAAIGHPRARATGCDAASPARWWSPWGIAFSPGHHAAGSQRSTQTVPLTVTMRPAGRPTRFLIDSGMLRLLIASGLMRPDASTTRHFLPQWPAPRVAARQSHLPQPAAADWRRPRCPEP